MRGDRATKGGLIGQIPTSETQIYPSGFWSKIPLTRFSVPLIPATQLPNGRSTAGHSKAEFVRPLRVRARVTRRVWLLDLWNACDKLSLTEAQEGSPLRT